jgi:acyl-CoA synthetase
VFLTPTHAVDVLAAIKDGAAAPESLQRVVIGGAATPGELKAALRTQLGAGIVSMYGSTENQGATFVRPGDDPARADSTVGRPCPGMSVAVLAPDRHTAAPAGEIGEIATRGPGNFAGYYDDQAATDAAMNRDGWFLTGDLGILDEDGFLRVTGRHKELIIRGGMNITPEDVERALADHPALERVAAVGIADERLGEVVCAVVVADGKVTLSSLTEHLRAGGVGTHLWPEALLQVAEFPLTDIGKVQRGRLRELANEAVKHNALERAAYRQVPQ